MHLAISGEVSEGTCSHKSASKGKKFKCSGSSNTVQMETQQREILKKKTYLTIFFSKHTTDRIKKIQSHFQTSV